MHMTVTARRSERGPARRRVFPLIARLFSKALERSRQRRALSALPAHLLHDIGLMRSDFDHWGDANDPSRGFAIRNAHIPRFLLDVTTVTPIARNSPRARPVLARAHNLGRYVPR
jgi:uncharacterized protein YjiS (DUF1127 family)